MKKGGDISSDVPLIRMQNAGAIVDAMQRDQLAGLQTRGKRGSPAFSYHRGHSIVENLDVRIGHQRIR